MSKNKMSKKERRELEKTAAANAATMKVVSFLAFIFAILGIITYFIGLKNIAAICACLTLLNSLFQLLVGGQRDFGFELVFIVVGALISRIFKLDMFYTVVIALLIGDAALQLSSMLSARYLRNHPVS